jgi:hypothetical protein
MAPGPSRSFDIGALLAMINLWYANEEETRKKRQRDRTSYCCVIAKKPESNSENMKNETKR